MPVDVFTEKANGIRLGPHVTAGCSPLQSAGLRGCAERGHLRGRCGTARAALTPGSARGAVAARTADSRRALSPSHVVQKADSFFPQASQTHRLVTMQSQRPGSLASHVSHGLCTQRTKQENPVPQDTAVPGGTRTVPLPCSSRVSTTRPRHRITFLLIQDAGSIRNSGKSWLPSAAPPLSLRRPLVLLAALPWASEGRGTHVAGATSSSPSRGNEDLTQSRGGSPRPCSPFSRDRVLWALGFFFFLLFFILFYLLISILEKGEGGRK